MSVPVRNTLWTTKMFQQGLCGLNSSSCWLCSWEVGGVPGEGAGAGADDGGKWQHSPGEQSHDLPYVLAAAEVGACKTWAS